MLSLHKCQQSLQTLVKLTKRGKKKVQIAKVRNERGNITINHTEKIL